MKTLLEEYRSDELHLIVEDATLVIPIGATEQHGPHLSLATDALIADHVARAAARGATTRDRPVIVSPTLNFGASDHHLPRAGTLSVRGTTYLSLLVDILESAACSGFRRVVLLNGHGGNEDLARQSAREVVAEYALVVAATGYWTLAWPELVELCMRHRIGALPGHAGAFETSVLQYLAPEYVDTSGARTSESGATEQTHPFAAPWTETHGWIAAIDGHSDGVHRAASSVGAEAFELIVAAAVRFLQSIAAQSPPSLVNGTGRGKRSR